MKDSAAINECDADHPIRYTVGDYHVWARNQEHARLIAQGWVQAYCRDTPPAAVTDQSLLTELLQSRFTSSPKFKVTAGSCNTFLLNDEGQTIVFSFDGSGRLVLVWAKEGVRS